MWLRSLFTEMLEMRAMTLLQFTTDAGYFGMGMLVAALVMLGRWKV